MILTGESIRIAVKAGDIFIRPFDEAQLGPNSYDFRLGNRCRLYRELELDAHRNNPSDVVAIPDDGMVLEPSRLYLVNTLETMGSTKYVPIIRGRSSVGRLGVFIDITADLIDIGSVNQWTLQLHCVMPVRVFPGMLIGQVTFWVPTGEIELYRGKYGSLESPVGSLAFRDARRNNGQV